MKTHERIAIEQRMADLADRMARLDHLNHPENLDEWAALYEERDDLDRRLSDDP